MAEKRPITAVEAAGLMLASCPTPMIVFSPDLTLLYINAAHERMTGRKAEDLLGRAMFDAFEPRPGEDNASARAVISASVTQMEASREAVLLPEVQHDLINAEGQYEERFFSIMQWPIYEDGAMAAVVQRSEDITEQVRQRHLTAAVKKSAEAASGLSFFSYDPVTEQFTRSSAIDAMFGFEPGEAGPLASKFFERIVPEDLPSVHSEVERVFAGGAGTSAAFDYRVEVPGEVELRYVRVRAGVERDPDDGAQKLFGVFVDMSDVEQARARMQELVERDSALVNESNHRIKNSLAIASSMLSYQMFAAQDDAVREALRSAANRIMAIADVHGELFADGGVEWVDAGRLMERFVDSFRRTIAADDSACSFDVTTQHIRLPSRYAVTTALILNELLTNAVKYGMDESKRCDVLITIAADDGKVRLSVTNPMADKRMAELGSEGVGSELIQAFVRTAVQN